MFINKSMSIVANNYVGIEYEATNEGQMVFALFTGTPPTADEFQQAVEDGRFNQTTGDIGNVNIKDVLSYISDDLGHTLLGTTGFTYADSSMWTLINEDLIEFDSSLSPETKFDILAEGQAGFLLTMVVRSYYFNLENPLVDATDAIFYINMSRVDTVENGGEVQISDTEVTLDKVIKLSSIKFKLN